MSSFSLLKGYEKRKADSISSSRVFEKEKITPRLQSVLLPPVGVKENLSHPRPYRVGVTLQVLSITSQRRHKLAYFVLFCKLSDQCPVKTKTPRNTGEDKLTP